MNPKLSVIIPIYNVEKYLRKCLESIILQTYSDLEIILVDDGSPDDCGIICDEFAEKDSRINVIHKENGGLCSARNEGIKVATGEWITFVDSDDWCEVEYYENIFKELGDQNVDIFIAGGHFKEYENKQIKKVNFTDALLFNEYDDMNYLMAKILSPNIGSNVSKDIAPLGAPWDKIYHLEFIREHNLAFDENTRAWEDLLFNFFAFSCAKSVSCGSYIGYHYRIINNSITSKFNPKRPYLNYYFIEKINNYIINVRNVEILKNALNARCISMMSQCLSTYYFSPLNKIKYNEKAYAIKEMKAKTCYSVAIKSKNNDCMNKKQIVLKLLMRLPYIWPLYLVYHVKQKVIVRN